MLTIEFPLSQKQAQSVVVAADTFGVEPWEIAVHVLALKQNLESKRARAALKEDQPGD